MSGKWHIMSVLKLSDIKIDFLLHIWISPLSLNCSFLREKNPVPGEQEFNLYSDCEILCMKRLPPYFVERQDPDRSPAGVLVLVGQQVAAQNQEQALK